MDVVRLSETLSWIRADEETYEFQQKLEEIQSALRDLTGSPGETSYQVRLNESLTNLSDAIVKSISAYDPAQIKRIIDIGAQPYFTEKLFERIKTQINLNPMSPAVALEDINQLVDDRREFITRVQETEKGVDSFVHFDTGLRPGGASVGFEIPRTLFDNEFKDFISELRAIQRIIRVFSEVETGAIPEIKLGSLSTSDPLIFLNAPPVVVVSIAGAVAWLLTQWKKFEEIRKIRAETAKIGEFKAKELEDFFDKKIKTNLDSAVAAKVKEMIDASTLEKSRKLELDSELSWAIHALFARVERGMRVEVAVKKLTDKELTEPQKEEQAVLTKAEKLSEKLSFPQIAADPILSLPKMMDQDSTPDRPVS